MLKKERQRLIIEKISKKKKLLASELSAEFNCSEDTIRRDLRELDQKGMLKRVHSGAISLGPAVTSFDQRISLNTNQKEKLAQEAITHLHEDSIILLDGSTTNYFVAKKLPEYFSATIITNSPYVSIELLKKKNITVINLGGVLAKRQAVSLGIETVQSLDSLRIDTYVMGVYNFHPEIGLSMHSQEEALVKQKMVEISDELIALATKDKLDVYSNYIYCEPSKIDLLITDSTDRDVLKKFQSKNIIVKSLD